MSADTKRVEHPMSPYAAWGNGPPSDPEWFPIMVWTQDPDLAPQYQELGVNTYFGLWQGPTEAQLATLARHRMKVICAQNEVGRANLDNPAIIAWMHGDEPDNRKRNTGEAVPIEKILGDYERIRGTDPTRPVVVNFGQGTSNDLFPGRAIDLQDYPQYARGADILSYDVYPISNIKLPNPENGSILREEHGESLLWYVAKGVRRLQRFTGYSKPVWNVIECTHIHNPSAKATPAQVKSQVWMSLIAGSRGICWFVHEFEPTHDPAALLSDPGMRQAVGEINHQVLSLARVLNQPAVSAGEIEVTISPEDPAAPISHMARTVDGDLYLFTANLTDRPTRATIRIRQPFNFDGSGLIPYRQASGEADVLDEARTLVFAAGEGVDEYAPHDVHLYRLPSPFEE